MLGAVPSNAGRQLVREVARVAAHAVDDAPTTPASADELRELLTTAGVWDGGIEQGIEAVLAHPTPDVVRGVIPHLVRADTFANQIVPTAIAAVDTGQLSRLTAAIDLLVAHGVTGNGLTRQLVEVADHPHLDEIIELAPLVHDTGAYPHSVLGFARDAVDSGRLAAYRRSLQSLVDDGIRDGAIAGELVAHLDHPRFDDVLSLATGFQKLGAFGFQSVPKARQVVDAGQLEQLAPIVDELVRLDVGNHQMVNQLVELAGDPNIGQVVELIPTLHRVVPNGYEIVPKAQWLLATGRAPEIARIANELADEGIAYAGLLESVTRIVDHPQLDRILEVARIVRDSGSSAHVLDKARGLVESPNTDAAIEMLGIIVDGGGRGPYASYVALDLVGRGVTLDDLRLALDLKVGRINHSSVTAALEASELEQAGLEALGAHLSKLEPTQLDEQRETLRALVRRLADTEPVDEVDRSLLAQLQTLASDNFQRLAGVKVDGYRGYPEYAELGRIDATIRLRALRDRTAAASEQLPW